MVHANTLLSLPEAAVARACGLPVVLQVHELPAPGFKATATIRYAAGIADVLVGVSEAVSRASADMPGAPRCSPYETASRSPRSRRAPTTGSSPSAPSAPSPARRTSVFLRAARMALDRRPGMRFEHAGAHDLHRDAGLDDELARLTDEIPPEGITILGHRPAEDVLPEWNVFVCSSRSEAFPLATLEAMAMGIPVVATTVGGLPGRSSISRAGFSSDQDDPEAIATWLARLYDDADLRRRLGRAGAERVRKEFTLERQAEGSTVRT